MKCLENNGYDKTKCGAAFDNYNVCKKFWNEVISDLEKICLDYRVRLKGGPQVW